jgi:hypothetical protein
MLMYWDHPCARVVPVVFPYTPLNWEVISTRQVLFPPGSSCFAPWVAIATGQAGAALGLSQFPGGDLTVTSQQSISWLVTLWMPSVCSPSPSRHQPVVEQCTGTIFRTEDHFCPALSPGSFFKFVPELNFWRFPRTPNSRLTFQWRGSASLWTVQKPLRLFAVPSTI